MIDAPTIKRCRAFIGRKREATDSISREPAEKLAVLLGCELNEHVPLCWHWVYFNAVIPPENVGHDGHEKLGIFLPDVPLPRRMWAAGDIEVMSPLRFGVPAIRRTRIIDVAFKEGRTGDLCFATLLHEISQDQPAIRETQTIVYRQAGQPEKVLRAPEKPAPDDFRTLPDTTLLSYSALTQNGHRIHWDRDFCKTVEGYPGLVVHGPLLATYLAGALASFPGPCRFRYRAMAPIFETNPFRIVTEGPRARIERTDGTTAMEAYI